MLSQQPAHRLALGCGAILFCVLAVLNSGGYRYGIGDQAFYVPAVVQHLNPALFPRDRMLLRVQDQFMAFDDVSAMIVKAGISLPILAFLLHLAGLVLLFGAAVAIGRLLYRSWWTVALCTILLTLRHRITQTGANSLEAYFQPRMLAFALGMWAVASYLRGRGALAFALVAGAFALHPTTAIWFGVWLSAALAVTERRWRMLVLALGGIGTLLAIWMVMMGPLRGHLVKMDPRWASVLAGKDYIFPFDWTASFWIVNLGYVLIIAAIYLVRLRKGLALTRETGLVAGALALLIVFLISWPLMSAWIALALQLQTSRVFWLLDAFATIYLAWLLFEGLSVRFGQALVVLMLAVSAARGLYVMLVEHRQDSMVSVYLKHDDWTDAMTWIARTPASTHVLADPGHAWKYGTSVRVSGERDVYLEEVKDAALALYSRDVAMLVLGRTQDAGDFASITPLRALALARQYDLNYLVIDHDMDLPLSYRNARFRIYSLSSDTAR